MKSDFIDLLHGERDEEGERWTVQRLASGIDANRCHVTKVLRNWRDPQAPRFGRLSRPRLTRFIKARFKTWPAMLAALGWDEAGKFHREL